MVGASRNNRKEVILCRLFESWRPRSRPGSLSGAHAP